MCWNMEASGQVRRPSSSSERLWARSLPILSRCDAELKRKGLRAVLTCVVGDAAVAMGSPRRMGSTTIGQTGILQSGLDDWPARDVIRKAQKRKVFVALFPQIFLA